jgi:tungstate transport system substrate-binding protein
MPFVGRTDGVGRNNRPMLRRRLLAASLIFAAAPATRAQVASGPFLPLRLGVDRALVESGLARGLQHAFGADTGIAVKLVGGPALAVLDAVREGEVDAALTNAPDAEERLDKQGLVHDRRPIAAGEFVVVGPAPSRVRGKAPPPAGKSGVDALAHIHELATGAPDSLVFLSAGDGSGTHVAEQALWRTTHIEPVAPWYVAADAKSGFVAQVRARGAYALVERGAWSAQGGAPLAILAEGDPLLVESVHAMRAFRITHPAGKIFVAWIAGGRGRAVVAAHHGYRTP